jgi:hypothetical protein
MHVFVGFLIRLISECNVKYKFITCSFAKTWEIFTKHDHSHTNEKIVLRGIASPFKSVVNDLLEKGCSRPKKILKFLTKKRYEEQLLADFELPTWEKLQGYEARSGIAKNSNDIEIVQDYIAKNLFDPNAHVPQPNNFFFYGMKIDENGRPVVGDGSHVFPLHIHMTSFTLLKFPDDSDQGNRSIFYIDATYKLNINRFKLVCFDPGDPIYADDFIQ